MRIAWFCIPAYGHTNPTLGIVRELTDAGHQVFYFSLHGLMIVSPSGCTTTYLGTTLAGLGSMYASFMIPSIA